MSIGQKERGIILSESLRPEKREKHRRHLLGRTQAEKTYAGAILWKRGKLWWSCLGAVLMKGFIYALTSQEVLPDTILLYNNGAKLSTEGSDSLEDLKLLESQGVEILTCGTCLNYYGLTEKLAVGAVTNMYDICAKMMNAEKVVKP